MSVGFNDTESSCFGSLYSLTEKNLLPQVSYYLPHMSLGLSVALITGSKMVPQAKPWLLLLQQHDLLLAIGCRKRESYFRGLDRVNVQSGCIKKLVKIFGFCSACKLSVSRLLKA